MIRTFSRTAGYSVLRVVSRNIQVTARSTKSPSSASEKTEVDKRKEDQSIQETSDDKPEAVIRPKLPPKGYLPIRPPSENEEAEKKDAEDRKRYAQSKSYAVDVKDVVLADMEWWSKGPRSKDSFLDRCEAYQKTIRKNRFGQVEFIFAALRRMKDFGVHKDIQAYKGLMDVFPKEILKPTNVFQSMYFHFQKQQDCATEILHQMEYYGVEPDAEMERLVIEIFSKRSQPWRKIARQLYWFSKFRNANPFPLPEHLDNLEALELAKIALQRMCPDLQTRITSHSTNTIDGSKDHTWIVMAQSPTQIELIEQLTPDQPMYVEGPFTVYLKEKTITFFMLRADNRLKANPEDDNEDPLDVSNIPLHPHGKDVKSAIMEQRNIHIQEDGTVLCLIATGTSSRDSLLSSIRLLETMISKMRYLKVIFTLRKPETRVQPADGEETST